MENIGEKRSDIFNKWEEKSRDFIETFLLLFGREGRLVGIYGLYLVVLAVLFALYVFVRSLRF